MELLFLVRDLRANLVFMEILVMESFLIKE